MAQASVSVGDKRLCWPDLPSLKRQIFGAPKHSSLGNVAGEMIMGSLRSWTFFLLIAQADLRFVSAGAGAVLGTKGAERFAAAAEINHPNHVLGVRLGMQEGKNPLIAPGREHFVAGEVRVAKPPTVHYHSRSSMDGRKPGNAKSEEYSLLILGAPEGGQGTAHLHWLLVNCPVSKQRGDLDMSGCQEALSYRPPKPEVGTRIYVLYLFRQPEKVTVPEKAAVETVMDDFEVSKLSGILGTHSAGEVHHPVAVNFYYTSATKEDYEASLGQSNGNEL